MRSIVTVVVGIGLLVLTSCSETQPDVVVSRSANHVSDQSQPKSHDPAAAQPPVDEPGGHGHAASQTEVSHERGHDHANHGVSHAAHREGVHRAASGRETEQEIRNDHSGRGRPHAAHGHASNSRGTSDETKKIAIGYKVPDFEVMIDGRLWKLSELQKNRAMTEDGTLVLTFWCSFCHSCRRVEHHLDALAREYKGKVGVIALDASAGETTEGVAEFAKKRELTLPIALNAGGGAADIFGTRVTTTTVVIDKTGVLRYRGQFSDGQHAFSQDALRAVLANKDVPVQETRQKG